MAIILALGMVLAWNLLLFFRGDFWRLARLYSPALPVGNGASVVVIVPARDEAEGIAETVRSLLVQDYKGSLHIILIDDHSSDNTAAIAREAAARAGGSERLSLITGSSLPPGWTGKIWALHQGLAAAQRYNPEFVLFTDGDISHAPDNVAQLVAHADSENLDLASLMVRLHCVSFAEKALIPAFVFFFLMLYPPQWIADREARTAGAAGGCMLVRYRALSRIGGMETIRGALIDDCALAAVIKKSGGSIRLNVTKATSSTRVYKSLKEIWVMITRTAFAQLKYSFWLLGAALGGLLLVYIGPLFCAVFGHGFMRFGGILAWIAMVVAFQPTLRLYGRHWVWGLALPLIAVFYASATAGSAVNYWRGRGGQWKGRMHTT